MTANGKKRGRPFGIPAHNRGKKMKEPHEYAAYKKAQAKAEQLATQGPTPEEKRKADYASRSGSGHWTHRHDPATGQTLARGRPAGGSGQAQYVAKKAAASSAEGRRPLHWTQQPVEGGGTRGAGANHWTKRPPKLDANGAEIPRKRTGRKPKGDKKGDASHS